MKTELKLLSLLAESGREDAGRQPRVYERDPQAGREDDGTSGQNTF